MTSLPPRPLAMILLALTLLCLTACASHPTPASIARTERPMLPTPPQELQRAERLAPIKVGDRDEYALRHREAASAVERLNNRIAGWITWAACQRALLAGEKRDGC